MTDIYEVNDLYVVQIPHFNLYLELCAGLLNGSSNVKQFNMTLGLEVAKIKFTQ